MNKVQHSPIDPYKSSCYAFDILIKVINQKETLNCRNMTLILNAIYLNMSIKSRYVICFQKEEIENCHFVVETFIAEKNKWILVDSSYGFLFQNNKGDYVSLCELRELLAKNKPLNGEKSLYIKTISAIYSKSHSFSSASSAFVSLLPSINSGAFSR